MSVQDHTPAFITHIMRSWINTDNMHPQQTRSVSAILPLHSWNQPNTWPRPPSCPSFASPPTPQSTYLDVCIREPSRTLWLWPPCCQQCPWPWSAKDITQVMLHPLTHHFIHWHTIKASDKMPLKKQWGQPHHLITMPDVRTCMQKDHIRTLKIL